MELNLFLSCFFVNLLRVVVELRKIEVRHNSMREGIILFQIVSLSHNATHKPTFRIFHLVNVLRLIVRLCLSTTIYQSVERLFC